MKKRLEKLLAEYGVIALVLHLTVMAIVVGGAYIGIRAGWTPKSATGKVGTWAAVYAVHLATKPLRIGLTIVLTPIVAKIWDWAAGRPRNRQEAATREDAPTPPAA